MERAQNATEQVIAIGSLTLSIDEQSGFLDGVRLQLTPREYEVLEMIARRSPNLVPKHDIAQLLAQSKPDVIDSAVELYVSRLRKKLADAGVKIATVRGIGYQLAIDRQRRTS